MARQSPQKWDVRLCSPSERAESVFASTRFCNEWVEMFILESPRRGYKWLPTGWTRERWFEAPFSKTVGSTLRNEAGCGLVRSDTRIKGKYCIVRDVVVKLFLSRVWNYVIWTSINVWIRKVSAIKECCPVKSQGSRLLSGHHPTTLCCAPRLVGRGSHSQNAFPVVKWRHRYWR